jgi:DNA-binding beta-propeller fold protein YncE
MTSGSVLELSTDGKHMKTLVENQSLPDGVAVDPHTGRVFWTNMGIPGKNDGSVLVFDRQENTTKELVSKGSINTPKQLALDTVANKIYFCDREGLSVYRCNFDGSQLEKIVQAGNPNDSKEAADARNWCVGITVAPKLGKFYWTQKGPSKSGQGRIFSANISLPADQSLASRTDIECIIDGLPEPIDLEIDETSCFLYWTDRGEIPYGNSLNRLQLDKSGNAFHTSTGDTHNFKVLSRHFNEAIGLKLDTKNNTIYVTDLGGNIYRCDLNGENKSVLHFDKLRAFTGIAF